MQSVILKAVDLSAQSLLSTSPESCNIFNLFTVDWSKRADPCFLLNKMSLDEVTKHIRITNFQICLIKHGAASREEQSVL